jgi:hypothetical protein
MTFSFQATGAIYQKGLPMLFILSQRARKPFSIATNTGNFQAFLSALLSFLLYQKQLMTYHRQDSLPCKAELLPRLLHPQFRTLGQKLRYKRYNR